MKKNSQAISLGCFILVILLILSVTGCSGAAPSSTASQAEAPASTADSASSQAPSSAAAEAKPVTLRFSWWGDDLRHEATLAAIEKYKEFAPHVTVEAEYSGADTYHEKLATQLATNASPEIAQILPRDPQRYYDLFDAPFVDLYKYGFDASGFDEAFLLQWAGINGGLYGAPTGINCETMILNTALLDKVGIKVGELDWTWEMVIEEGKKVHQSDPEAYFFCLDQTFYANHMMNYYLMQRIGTYLVNDDYTVNFTKEQATEFYAYVKRLFDEGVSQPAAESFAFPYSYNQNPLWVNGKAAAAFDYASFFTSRTVGFADTADVALLPRNPDKAYSSAALEPASLLAVSKGDPDKIAESVKFLEYFFYNEEAIKSLRDVRSIPATEIGRKVADENNLLNPSVLKAIQQALADPGLARNVLSGDKQLEATRNEIIERVVYGQLTPEQAGEEIITQLQAKLDDMKAQM